MASTDALPVPQKNVAYRHYFAIRKNDGSLITSWTGADSELSLDGGTMADATNEATEIATNSGCGYIDLTSTEMNNDAVMLKVTVTNTDAVPYVVTLFPEEAGDIRTNVTEINDSATAAVNLARSSGAIVYGTVTDTETETTTEFTTSIDGTGEINYEGRTLVFLDGAVIGQAVKITATSDSSPSGDMKVTVEQHDGSAMPDTPVSGDAFIIV